MLRHSFREISGEIGTPVIAVESLDRIEVTSWHLGAGLRIRHRDVQGRVVDLDHGMQDAVDHALEVTTVAGAHVLKRRTVAVETTPTFEGSIEDSSSDGNLHPFPELAQIEPGEARVDHCHSLAHGGGVGGLLVVDDRLV